LIYDTIETNKKTLEAEILDMIERSKGKEVEYDNTADKEYIQQKLNEKFDNHMENLYQEYIKVFFSNRIEIPLVDKLKIMKDDIKINFWDEFSKLYDSISLAVSKEFKENLKFKFNYGDQRVQENGEILKEKMRKFAQKQLQEFASNFLDSYICKLFEHKFHHQTNGRVEIWKTASTEYLEKKFEAVMNDCKSTILLFETFETSELDKSLDGRRKDASFMIIPGQSDNSIAILNQDQIEKYKQQLDNHAKLEKEKAIRECKSKGLLENLFYEVIPTFVEDKLSKLKK